MNSWSFYSWFPSQGAITRILSKREEIDSVDCDLETKEVLIKAKEGQELDVDAISTAIGKWAKPSNKEYKLLDTKEWEGWAGGQC